MQSLRALRVAVLAAVTLLLLAGAGAGVATQAAPPAAEEPGTIVATGHASFPAEATGLSSTVTIVVIERAASKEAMPAAFATVRDKTAHIRAQLLGGGIGVTSAQIRVQDVQVSSGSSIIGPGGINIPLPPGLPGGPTPVPPPPPGATPTVPPLPSSFPASVTQRILVDVSASQIEPVVLTAQNAGASNVSSSGRPASGAESPNAAALADAVRRATEQAHALAPAAAAASQRGLGFMRKVEVHDPVLGGEVLRPGFPLTSWIVRVTVTYDMAQ